MTQKNVATQDLLNNAVNNTPLFSRKGLLDRLFAKWFNRLVYPQIWEDPEVDIEALDINTQSRIFCISSGGCNVFNYLTEHPTAITVVDLNEAHIALINLKKTALKHLPDSEAFFDFFGRANLPKNIDRYNSDIRPHLDEKTRQYWDEKPSLFSKPRIYYFTDGFYSHGLLGNFIGLIHWVSKRLGYDISRVMLARTPEEQTQLFNQHVAPVFDTRLIKFLAKSPIVLYSLGIPPAQFDEMDKEAKDNQHDMHETLKERARHLACDFPLETNYFAWQAFEREYDVQFRLAIPRYLKAQYFEVLKAQTNKVHIHHASMTDQLKAMPANSLNSYVLLDAQDWMDATQLTELWTEINRTAMPNATVVFRTAGTQSPLEGKLPEEQLASWKTDKAQNKIWTQNDRSAIYGGVHVYRRQAQ